MRSTYSMLKRQINKSINQSINKIEIFNKIRSFFKRFCLIKENETNFVTKLN